MQRNIKQNLYHLTNKTQLCLFFNQGRLYIKGPMGVVILLLPSLYFHSYANKQISLLFLTLTHTRSFLSHLRYLEARLHKLYFVKFKIKGLGYRFKRINQYLYRFFFNFTNFLYLHVPNNILIKSKRKKVLLLSNNRHELQTLLAHLLLLKRFTAYRARGLVYPRQIILLKVGKKNI